MLNLEVIKVQKVSDVEPGQLVLYQYGQKLLPALRILTRASKQEKEDALLVMPFELQPNRVVPYVFRDVKHERCYVLGKAFATWHGETQGILWAGQVDARPGYLAMHTDGVAIAGLYSQSGIDRSYWRLSDGTELEADHRQHYVTQWEMGVNGMKEEFVPFVRYPKDFSAIG